MAFASRRSRWLKDSPGSRCDQVAGTIDILPTLVELAGAAQPKLTIDGKNIWPLLTATEGASSPHEAWYYYWDRELHAIRSGPWKLHFPHGYRTLRDQPGRDGLPGEYVQARCGRELYQLDQDVGERHDVAAGHPDVVARLERLADAMRLKLGDSLTGVVGSEIRPAGQLP